MSYKDALTELRTLLAPLQEQHVQTCTIAYNGYGDEGSITEVVFIGGDGKYVTGDVHAASIGTQYALQQWAYDLLEQVEAGWEIDEGSTGEIEIDVVNGEVKIEHGEKRIEVDYRTITLDLSTLDPT